MANEEKILELLVDIKGSVDNLDKRVGTLETRFDRLETKVDEMDKRLTEVANVQETIVLPQLNRLTEDLASTKESLRDTNDRLMKVAIVQENVVLPQLELLAEGQTTILETLAPKSRVEALEEEIVYIKSDISMLRKAE